MLVIVFDGSIWARGGDFHFLVIIVDEVGDVRDSLAEMFHKDRALGRWVLPVVVENSYEEFWVWDFQPRRNDFGGLEVKELSHVG